MELVIEPPLTAGVNLPGLPQAQPPIQIGISRVDFDLSALDGDSLGGHLAIGGEFRLRPISAAGTSFPVPPFMAAHIEKLFKAATLSSFKGSAKLDLSFQGDESEIRLSCVFEDAGVELDLFDMLSSLARGMVSPQGMNSGGNEIDLDIDVDIRLRAIQLQFGSLANATPSESNFIFELMLDATFAGIQIENFSFRLSSQEFSFGFGRLAVPVALPRFPAGLNDFNQLRDSTGLWDYENLWILGREPELTNAIRAIKEEIENLMRQLTGAAGPALGTIEKALRKKRKELFDVSGRKFLMQSVLGVRQLVQEPNRPAYQKWIEAYLALMDATIHQFSFDTTLDFVLRDVRFVLPFQNPTDIRVEGGAQLTGFKSDDPLAPLAELVFKIGLSAEYVYFSVEGGEPIPLGVFGEYVNEAGQRETKVSLRLNHARIGYGYSKNALNVAFAGELNIARPLADDLNTAEVTGIGIRLPERSRLGFKLDLIPIVLGEVDFLLPLLDFDIDLRKEFSPATGDGEVCAPFWDGLQLIAPNVIRWDFKRLRFAPFFGSLPAPNYKLSFDLMLGDANNGITLVCDDQLVIVPISTYTTVPLLADGVPFFNNLCVNLRLAGFEVNFDLQRPFPSMSPLALFEIFGLLADPAMPIDPNGQLANTLRASVRNARIVLPPAVVRMFPEHGRVVKLSSEMAVNLGTIITAAQALAEPVSQMTRQLQEVTDDINGLLDKLKANPPKIRPGAVLALLPPEFRRIDLKGSFAGFEASAAIALLKPDEVAEAFAQRDKHLVPESARLAFDEHFDDPHLFGWQIIPAALQKANWHAEEGELRQTSRNPLATYVLHTSVFHNVRFSTVMRSDGGTGIGAVFAYQDEGRHYRLVMSPVRPAWELVKVHNGKETVLQSGAIPKTADLAQWFSVTVSCESVTPGASGMRIRFLIEDLERFNYLDSTAAFDNGRIGLFCQANSDARFKGIRAYRMGPASAPQQGELIDPAWLMTFQPHFSRPGSGVHMPGDSILSTPPFDAFDTDDLSALPSAANPAGGVLAGAVVKIPDDQLFRFLGYLFVDGTFSLISALDIKQLRLVVSGIAVELPLELHSRLELSGRAQGAQSFSKVSAKVWGTWQPLPGVITLTAGSQTSPIDLTLQSHGRFALQGSGSLDFFGGGATINGSVDVSHTHCFVQGSFKYQPQDQIGNKRVIELILNCKGRVGPANRFELSGAGTLKILGKTIAGVSGLVSERGIAVEAQLDSGTWNWNGISIKKFSMALRGAIDLGAAGPPSFLLEGATYIRLFGSATSKSRAEISGRGGIQARGGELNAFVEGKLYWQGREWVAGRLELGTEHLELKGRTAFALDMTPAKLPAGIQVANLYFRIDLAGGFKFSTSNALEACNLDADWMLAVKMPGMAQRFPIAMQKIRVEFSSQPNSSPQAEIELMQLLDIDNALFLPMDKLAIPVPSVVADEYRQYYWYWQNITPETRPAYKKVTISTEQPDTSFWMLPRSIGKTGDLDLAETIADAFNLPEPSVAINVPEYGVDEWRYITVSDDELPLPDISAPRVAPNPPANVEKHALFSLPTHFTASFPPGHGNVTMLRNLQLSLALAWKNGKLGLTVKKGAKKTFRPFDEMFD
jgi:hypothetical protein